ncbi:MAG: pitrilysin family protein [Bacteroidetes bacterium]|nr:pitrilysin family protein [Bacteroidota bacterium]
MNRILLILVFIASALVSSAQVKLIEKVTRKGDELTIPYEMYRLKNGLTIIVHEDHSDPLVHVDVTYHVGSAREEVGKSGFAHFFEHMMFQGSKHVGDDQHFKIVSNAGGTLNGTTNRDRTNYYETVPKNQLEVALWLEADRMGFLLDSVNQIKFENQRETVKNERGQNYDNRPYGLVQENISRAFYPQAHPYSWLTIGYINHLNAVDVDDLKNFFLRWYGPNNAVLSIGGDVKTADVIKMVDKYFGTLKKCPEVKKMPAMQPVLTEDRYVSMSDNIRQPLLRRVYSSVPSFHSDEAALDMLCEILSSSKSSVFYTKFIKSQLASSASVSNSSSELSGELTFNIMAYPNVNLSTIDSVMNTCFTEFELRGITNDDLLKAKASTETAFIKSLESVSGKMSTLAYYYTFGGKANLIQSQLREIQEITKLDILRAYNLYVKNKHYVCMSVYPKDKINVARTDNYKTPEADAPALKKVVKIKLPQVKDKFDRSIQPKVATERIVPLPIEEVRLNFANGVQFSGLMQNEIPFISIQITIKGGHLMDAYNPQTAGLAVLTARLMNEGTATMLTEQFESELDKIGSTISVSADAENTYINVGTLKKNLDLTLGLLSEKLLYPAFREEEFERAKKQQLEGISNSLISPASIADRCFNRVIYGENHIKSVPNEGTSETVKNITLADVKKFYKQYYVPQLAGIVAVGDVVMEQLVNKLAFINQWGRTEAQLPEAFNKDLATIITATKIYFIHSDKAAQSQIRIGNLALAYDVRDLYFKAGIMNFMFGGTFNSHLNMNLREHKGWTYGVRSSFSGTKYKGPFMISGGFKKSATDSTLSEIFSEMKNYRTTSLTQEELDFTKNAINQGEALKYETMSQKANILFVKQRYMLQPDYKMIQMQILMGINSSELTTLASRYLDIANMYIVVVGDRKVVKPKLGQWGYEVIELDAEGKVLQ